MGMGKSPLVEKQQTVLTVGLIQLTLLKMQQGQLLELMLTDRYVMGVLSPCKHFIFEVITLRCVTKLDVTLLFAWILVPQALQLDSILPFSPSNTILK